MKIKQIWSGSSAKGKGRFSLSVSGGVIAIVVLMMALILLGVFFGDFLPLSRQAFSLLLAAAVTALAVCLALRLGWYSVKEATLFFLTEDDRLFVFDARTMGAIRGRGVWGFFSGNGQTDRFLRQFSKTPFLPKNAREILRVRKVKENRRYYAISCETALPKEPPRRSTCFLVKGCPEESQLLGQLQRRESWESQVEKEDSSILPAVVSGAVLLVLALFCVFSHPAVAKLPEVIYFPCLFLGFAAVFVFVIFLVRYRRGE